MDTQDKLNKEIHDKLDSIIHDWYWKDDKLTETINELYPYNKKCWELLDSVDYEYCPWKQRRVFLTQLSAAVFRMEYAREVERIRHEKEKIFKHDGEL